MLLPPEFLCTSAVLVIDIHVQVVVCNHMSNFFSGRVLADQVEEVRRYCYVLREYPHYLNRISPGFAVGSQAELGSRWFGRVDLRYRKDGLDLMHTACFLLSPSFGHATLVQLDRVCTALVAVARRKIVVTVGCI